MLNSPNERIDEIFRESQDGLQNSIDQKSKENGRELFFMLFLFAFLLAMVFHSLQVGLIFGSLTAVLIFAGNASNKAVNGGSRDPDFYMPYIMRMVGEILSDVWGEYTYAKEQDVITVRFLSASGASNRNPHIIQFKRVYVRGEDGYDDRKYTIYVGHPLMTYFCEQGQLHPYDELKKRVSTIEQGVLTSFDGIACWSVLHDLKNGKGKKFSDIGEYERNSWFEFARALAAVTLNIANRVERAMDEISSTMPEKRT